MELPMVSLSVPQAAPEQFAPVNPQSNVSTKAEPCTAKVNCCWPLGAMEVTAGLMDMPTGSVVCVPPPQPARTLTAITDRIRMPAATCLFMAFLQTSPHQMSRSRPPFPRGIRPRQGLPAFGVGHRRRSFSSPERSGKEKANCENDSGKHQRGDEDGFSSQRTGFPRQHHQVWPPYLQRCENKNGCEWPSTNL